MRPIIVLVILALAALVGACTPTGGPADDRLRVVATTTQVGSVAAEVGGDDIHLTTLLTPGVEAHDYEMTPADAAALEEADVVLISGAGLEDWLEDALAATSHDDRVHDLSDGVELRTPSGDEPAHDHDADAPHDDDPHEDEAHDGELDPHYWLAAEPAMTMVANVRDALSAADPDRAGAYAERAEELIGRLRTADAEVRALIDGIPEERRRIVTDHDALGYFIEAYGLTYVGSIFPSLDVSTEPSARHLEELIHVIRDEGVVAIFSESAVNPRLARAISDETDARLVEEPLYTDSLGPPESGAETLDGMLLHNARVIHAGLAED